MEGQNDTDFVPQHGGRNLTHEFAQRFNTSNAAPEIQNVQAIKDCDILFVHGWLGEVAIRLTGFLDRLNCNQRVLDYLKDQRIAADELGLCSTAPPFRSESVCACGEKLARLIASNPRPVIIVSHSKGSLDTLDALMRLQRGGQLSNVAGWIAIQSPFYGSEDAATFMHRKNPVGRLRIKMLGANLDGVRDMVPTAREEYMALNQSHIDELIRCIPVICFASWRTPARANEGMSDGHVTPDSAILPGSDYIAVSGISHSMPVISRKPELFDRVAFTKTLLAMLSDRILPSSKQ